MAGRRAMGWTAALLVSGLGAWLALRPPAERMLLDRASIAIPAGQYDGGTYSWLSDTALLVGHDWVDTAHPQTSLFRWDLPTRTTKDMGALRTRMPGANSTEYAVSPDGEWVLSGPVEERLSNRPAIHFRYVCRVDGTQLWRQPLDHGNTGARWLPDSRHWMELYGRHVLPAAWKKRGWMNINSAPIHLKRIEFCDVNTPGRCRTLDIPASSLLGGPDVYRTFIPIAEDRFLTWGGSFAAAPLVVLQEFGPDSQKPRRRYAIQPPRGKGAVQLVFSPKGDQVLWKIWEERQPGEISHLWHRLVPSYQPQSIERVSLWVSRIDGSAMHEIGGVNNSVPEMQISNGPTDPETGEPLWGPPVPRLLRWSPDGKRISFAYRGAVWTAPAE